jgi:hypothetical protein
LGSLSKNGNSSSIVHANRRNGRDAHTNTGLPGLL